jgi:hypothetical protein
MEADQIDALLQYGTPHAMGHNLYVQYISIKFSCIGLLLLE